MMKRALTACAAVAMVLVLAQGAGAQNIVLDVTPSSFQYPSADPVTTPLVSSPTLAVNFKVPGNPRGVWSMTVRAETDLQSGSDSIPASNISWMATGPGFVSGTLGTTDQTLATGSGNVTAMQHGYITFRLKNLWTYNAGTYSHTIVFTLAAP